ncbi:hypothetical protein TCSYLVIO_002706 [Trypanosoma cruzi]|nr:hypothetical protein TCSYLVIO_002706 [Trypanosoma cruzi]
MLFSCCFSVFVRCSLLLVVFGLCQSGWRAAMSLKVWVKRGGMGDEEALGIHVPVDGTAQSVVDACRGVFRHLQPTRAALCTEDGIIVARASPVIALRSHTLELIELPPEEAPKRRVANTTTINRNSAAAAASSAVKSENFVRQTSAEKETRRAPLVSSAAKKSFPTKTSMAAATQAKKTDRTGVGAKETCAASQYLAALWDGLPVFASPLSIKRSTPAVTGILRSARRAYAEAVGSQFGISNKSSCDRVPSLGGGQSLLIGDGAVAVLRQSEPAGLAECLDSAKDNSVRHDNGFWEAAGENGTDGLKDRERGAPSQCELIALEEVQADRLENFSPPHGTLPCSETVATAVTAAVSAETELETSHGSEGAAGEAMTTTVAGAVEITRTFMQTLDPEEEQNRTAAGNFVGCGEKIGTADADRKETDGVSPNTDESSKKAPAYFEEW